MLKRISKIKISAINIIILLASFQLQISQAAPRPQTQNEIDDYGGGLNAAAIGNNPNFDYNNVMGHFKDFVMYLPVMMTTLKETMTGFPKFAEGIRILTSKSGRLEDGDCNCKGGNSNEIDSSDRF